MTERPCLICSKLFTPKRAAKCLTCSVKCSGVMGGRKRVENRASGAMHQSETVSNVGTEQPDKT
jgi:hypothetical protein